MGMIISDHMSRFMLFSCLFFFKHITFLTSETHIKVNTARAGLRIFSYLTNYQYLMTEKSNISSDWFFFSDTKHEQISLSFFMCYYL